MAFRAGAMAESVRLFLSCVSGEFGAYRDELRRRLNSRKVETKIQEDFERAGGGTLKLLEDYVATCEVVIHFVGDMTGGKPSPSNVDDLVERNSALAARLERKGMDREALGSLTYTQWEAWLAVGLGKNLVIVAPAESAPRGPAFAPTEAARASQALHLKRLRATNRYPGPPFATMDALAAEIFETTVIDALVKAASKPVAQPRNLPFVALGALFVGRERALEALHDKLASAKAAPVGALALHGLGGIGKTQLAIEYAFANAEAYSALLFVRADSAATLDGDLAKLAGPEILDLQEEFPDDRARSAAVRRWLTTHQTWLLILDNVDDDAAVAAVAELLPRLAGGHVIVTARASNFPGSVETLELAALDEAPATQFLLLRTRGKRVEAADDEARAREIARELGGLALGLEQAGAYIARLCVSFPRYLKIWAENRDKFIAWPDAAMTGPQRTLATTWISVERLAPDSRRLLDRLALLAPAPIPNALFDVPVPRDASGDDPYEARAGLAAYSLIAQARDDFGRGAGWTIHRLVQDFARRAISDARQDDALAEALGWVDAAFAWDPQDIHSWPMLDPLAPHALAIARRADDAGVAGLTGRLPYLLALLSYEKGRYDEAEPLYRRALALDEASHGPVHGDVSRDLNGLVVLLRATNRFAEAEPLARRALAIDEATAGPDHPDAASSLNNLAQVLKATNRLTEAEPLMRRALAIDEKCHGPDHPDVGVRLSNLALLLQETNRPSEAEELMRRALAILKTSYGPNDPKVAAGLNNLANLLQDTNRLAEAEPLLRRASSIHAVAYGPNHPTLGVSEGNLGRLLTTMNRYAEAEPLCRRALAIHEASLGPDHPQVASGLVNLANILIANGLGDEAEPLFRRALTIVETSLGPDHPDVAAALGNLAGTLEAMNRFAEAEPLRRRALAIDEARHGPDHPAVAICLFNLSGLFFRTNRRAEAEPLVRRALAIFERSLGPDHPYTQTVRDSLATLVAQPYYPR